MRMILALLFLLAYPAVLFAQGSVETSDWIPLFNGKNLDGWIPKIKGYETGENYADTFRVEDGILAVSYEDYDQFDGRFGHLFYQEKFSHYVLRVEYRFIGEQQRDGPSWALRNSGLMLHCQSPQSMLVDQDFPISIEVQLLGGTGMGDRTTANLCTPGTNVEMEGRLITQHCIDSTSATYEGDQWVTVEVRVLGSTSVEHIVEGQQVLTYQRPQLGGGAVNNFDEGLNKDQTLLEEGYIALQSESHPIQFRKVELLNLVGCTDPDASNYRSYYVKSDPSQCRYEK